MKIHRTTDITISREARRSAPLRIPRAVAMVARPEPFPAVLRRMRRLTGWEATDIEALGGPDRSTVIRVENGSRNASRYTLTLIAGALQLSEYERAKLFASAGFLLEGWVACRE